MDLGLIGSIVAVHFSFHIYGVNIKQKRKEQKMVTQPIKKG